MRLGDAFPSNYLKASDLQGKRVVVTIDHVALEEVGREKQRKPVVYFQGKDKGMVCNVTNARKIASILGTDEMDDWGDGQVVLFAAMVEFGGETVEGLRVGPIPMGKKAPTKPVKAPEPAADPEEYNPANDSDDTPF
jgi:hypothetical protein